MALIKFDEFVGELTGRQVVFDHETQEYVTVRVAQSCQQRGVLGRWLPVRGLECDCWRHRLQRLKHAWGVLVGRYDAFDWRAVDEETK